MSWTTTLQPVERQILFDGRPGPLGAVARMGRCG